MCASGTGVMRRGPELSYSAAMSPELDMVLTLPSFCRNAAASPPAILGLNVAATLRHIVLWPHAAAPLPH